MRTYQNLGCLFCGVLLAAGCACAPNYASKAQVVSDVEKRVSGESITCTGSPEQHRYTFKSNVRELEFEGGTGAETVTIDGADFGYTGNYTIYDNYRAAVTAFYAPRVYELMKQHGFTDYETSKPEYFAGPREFVFVMSDDYTSADLDAVDSFLAGLRELTKEEAQYHDDAHKAQFQGDYVFFSYELHYASPSGYYRTTGPSGNYQSGITCAFQPDVRSHEILDRSYALSDEFTPLTDSVLIYVPQKD